MINECGAVGVMRIGRETDVWGENPLQCHFIHNETHMTWSRTETGPLRGKPATNCLRYGTAALTVYKSSFLCIKIHSFETKQDTDLTGHAEWEYIIFALIISNMQESEKYIT
jgi:hypothetical protein